MIHRLSQINRRVFKLQIVRYVNDVRWNLQQRILTLHSDEGCDRYVVRADS